MPKAKDSLTTREICDQLRIHRHTLEKWVKAGLPIAGRKATRGRSSWLFDPHAVLAWSIANGKNIPPAITGQQIKQAVIAQDKPAQAHPTPPPMDAPPGPASTPSEPGQPMEPIELQLKSERSQYAKLFQRFLKTQAGDDVASVAALAKAITIKSDALRRLELSVVEYRKLAGTLVELNMVKRTFYELASATRERVMALPGQLAPLLRQYLKNPDEIGDVAKTIDAEIRHALTVLPDTLPELERDI